MNVNFRPGDLVRVHLKIEEEEKNRVQIFEGVVLQIKGRGINKMFTVRRIGADNIGIERIFPVNMPSIVKVEIKREGKVRQARPFYLRGLGKRMLAEVRA